MTRATRTLSLVFAITAIYAFLLLLTPLPLSLALKLQIEILPVLPFWALVSTGAYLLGRLGLGVLRFKNVESAYEELMGQLGRSREELRGRGVGVD